MCIQHFLHNSDQVHINKTFFLPIIKLHFVFQCHNAVLEVQFFTEWLHSQIQFREYFNISGNGLVQVFFAESLVDKIDWPNSQLVSLASGQEIACLALSRS